MNLHSKGKGIDNSTVQNESQPLELHGSVHHPYCSAHYEFGTILNDCICDEFRASYERGIQHGLWLAEADLCAAAEREKQERDLDDLYDGIRYSIERVRKLKEKQ